MPAYMAVCDLMYRRELAGASVFLGVDGTVHGRRERAQFFDRNVDVPMMIIAVGGGEQIGRVLPELGGLARHPLITLERVRVCKRDGELLERPHELPGTDEHGLALWQKLMVYTSVRRAIDGDADSPGADPPTPAAQIITRRDGVAWHLGIPRRPRTSR